MFWIYLTLVLLAYSFTRNVFWSVFLGPSLRLFW